jgi:hypothetical protein
LATFPDIPCLVCDFCSSDQKLAPPSFSFHLTTPLVLAIHFPLSWCVRDFHPIDYAACRVNQKRKSHDIGLPFFAKQSTSHRQFHLFCSDFVNMIVPVVKNIRKNITRTTILNNGLCITI